MPQLGNYVQGDWNAQCDQCGRGFKFSSLNLRWDKLWCCSACWEIRQPQDLVRAVKDDQSVPIARPRVIGALAPFIWLDAAFGPPFQWQDGFGIFVWTD